MAEENLLKRVLPHSLEAEQSVLGAMLMDKEAVAAALDICSPDDFYSRQYGVIFESIAELFDEGKPVDMITVQAKLKEKDVPPEVAGIDFIRSIFDYSPTSANVKSYAGIVHEKAVKRRLIKVNEEIENRCYADADGMDELLAETEEKVFRILEARGASEIRSIEEVTVNVMVVAARPSMGKTAFVLNIVEHTALKKGLKCMVFSLEMSSEQLVNRLLSMESGIDAQKMRNGQLTSTDFDQLLEAAVRVSGASNLVIDDTPGISVAEVRSRCRKQKLEHGLDLVIIDYLQLMSGSSKKNDNRQQEISEISRNLKALAREMKAPAITGPCFPISVNPAPSSRTLTWSCSCTATITTTKTQNIRTRRKSSSQNSETAPSAPSPSSGNQIPPDS